MAIFSAFYDLLHPNFATILILWSFSSCDKTVSCFRLNQNFVLYVMDFEGLRSNANCNFHQLWWSFDLDGVVLIFFNLFFNFQDKAFRKKLLVEMAPRRSSDRIAIKAQQKEEEDKLAEIERQQEKERLAEIKKQEAEAKEKERQILSEKRQRGLSIFFCIRSFRTRLVKTLKCQWSENWHFFMLFLRRPFGFAAEAWRLRMMGSPDETAGDHSVLHTPCRKQRTSSEPQGTVGVISNLDVQLIN